MPCVEIHFTYSGLSQLPSNRHILNHVSNAIIVFYSVKNVTKVTHQHLLGEKNPHSVLTMPDFINAREAQRQTGFIQMDYEVQGNSFIGTKTKQRALFLLILEKNSHSLC